MELTDTQWREKLTDEQYRILREHGTERAFTGVLYNEHGDGQYRCAGCEQVLFESGDKFESGSGWPSFTRAAGEGRVTLHADNALGMRRTEVRCSRCDGHLGHLFDDGPADRGGMRYCINSGAMKFEKSSSERAQDAT